MKNKIKNKLIAICDQMAISPDRVLINDNSIRIYQFSLICSSDSWRANEVISLVRKLGYERNLKKSRDIFWKIKK